MRPNVTQPTCTPDPTGFVGLSGNSNVAGAVAGVVAGNNNNACGDNSFIGGGDFNGTGALGLGYAATVGGGESNEALGEDATIAGGSGNVVNGTGWGFIGGGLSNTMNGTNTGGNATIGGGEKNTENANFDFVGGGYSNTVNNQLGTVSGGYTNGVNGDDGTVAGGGLNDVAAEYGSVGGGEYNTIKSGWGTIGGGYGNTAGGVATVPGGKNNVAAGEGSFAAGVGSLAGYAGDFVWSDYAAGATVLKATAVNQFLARASGGVAFYSSKTLASGVKLAPGSGTWLSLSDRNAKSDVLPVSDDDILAKVSTLPISEWSYTTERGVRHLGPMAQDFYAAFNVGEDDRHITSIDEDGVALAAIKALNVRLNVKLHQRDAELRALRAELRSKDAALQQQLTALAAQVRSLGTNPR